MAQVASVWRVSERQAASARSSRQRQAAVAGGDLDLLAADLADQGGADLLEGAALAADQEAAAALTEEGLLRRAALLAQGLDVDAGSDPPADRRLGHRAGQSSVADVVG